MQPSERNKRIRDEIRSSFDRASLILSKLDATGYLGEIQPVTELICNALRSGQKLILFGNGGSASDAQHIAGELVGRFLQNRRPLPAISLAADVSVLTCIANDFDYKDVFARQIQALAVPGDIVWALSTSGNSPNVIAGLQAAREMGLTTVLMTGKGGGAARSFADFVLDVPADETARIQEVHMMTYHAICAAVEADLFANEKENQACMISAG